MKFWWEQLWSLGFYSVKSHQAVGEVFLWAACSRRQLTPAWRGKKWSTSLHWGTSWEGWTGLQEKPKSSSTSLLAQESQGNNTATHIWGPPHAVHPEAQKNKHFPLPLSLKRPKQFLFIPGSWGVLEQNQQLFKTLNILENTWELRSAVSLKKGKYNINPKLRSKGTSLRWCYLF